MNIYDFDRVGWGNAPTPYIVSYADWGIYGPVQLRREGHHLSEWQLLNFENGERVADAIADPDCQPEFHFAGQDWPPEPCYSW